MSIHSRADWARGRPRRTLVDHINALPPRLLAGRKDQIPTGRGRPIRGAKVIPLFFCISCGPYRNRFREPRCRLRDIGFLRH